MPRRAARRKLTIEALEDRTVPSAFLVKDINVNTADANPQNLVNVNGTLFFSAMDNDHSFGLWKSDGTAAGTTLVQEFNTGLGNFTNVNGELFFDVSNNRSGGPAQLWKSDGTTSGTMLVKDFTGQFFFSIITGTGGSNRPAAFQNDVYFVLVDAKSPFNAHLWKSDGTAAGTVAVDPGAFTVNEFGPSLTVFNGELYFSASDPVNGGKLWKTDGTDAGTQIADADVPNIDAFALTVANGSLYFFGIHDATFQTTDLLQSDGTHTSTVLAGFSNTALEQIVGSGGKLFFTAASTINPFQAGLWVSDGTGAGTRELNPANVSPFGLNPFNLHAVNGRVVFNGTGATDPFFLGGIWSSDGTDAGTVEITPTELANGFPGLFDTATAGNLLYFSAVGSGGNGLWQTDGTAAGTTLIAHIPTLQFFLSAASDLTFAGNTLFFTARDGPHGNELWESNGTAAGTMLVKDINTDTIGSFPSQMVDANGTLFFTADDNPDSFASLPGPEIWKSDGTAAGTQLAGTPVAGNFEFPADLTNANGTVFFFEANGPLQLWTVSANAAPQLIMDFSKPNDFVFSNFDLTAVGNQVFFTVFDGNTGEEDLWQSDGTTAGTHIVQPNVFVSANSEVAANGKLFFIGVDPNTFAQQLWVSDGTSAGTHIVDPAHPGTSVSNLTNVNGTLFYFDQVPVLDANGNTVGFDDTVWKTDGTTNTLLAHVNPNSSTDFAFAFPPAVNVNGTLYFFVEDNTTGTSELWTSNGTAAGTVPVAAVARPDIAFSVMGILADAAAVGSRLLFTATDPVAGEQLWTSDGTGAGTHVVTNITAGKDLFGNTLPFQLTAFAGRAFFTASDPAHGTELWQSDGTAEGTSLVQDINPGPASSIGGTFNQLTPSGGALFFDANDGTHGDELWAYYPATHFGVTTTASVTTPGSPFTVTITALDRNGNVDTAYEGTVQFTSSDGSAALPAAYKFTTADQGVHSFTFTLNTPGNQTITATDAGNGSITGSETLLVPRDVSSLVHTVTTPPHLNHTTGLFDGQLIIQDITGTTINGPIQVVLSGLPAGVTLTSASSGGVALTIGTTASGDTIITLNVSQLTAGAAVRINLEFSDPLLLPIDFVAKTYADS